MTTAITTKRRRKTAAEELEDMGLLPPGSTSTTTPAATQYSAAKPTAAATRAIVRIPLEKIHPHPANRRIDPTTCRGLAESLKRRGLLRQDFG